MKLIWHKHEYHCQKCPRIVMQGVENISCSFFPEALLYSGNKMLFPSLLLKQLLPNPPLRKNEN